MTASVVPFNRPQGGFEAGQYGRRLRSIPVSTLAINSVIRQYGRTAIARSRFLCVNNPFMAQAKEEFSAALVGTGIKPNFIVDDEDVKKEITELWYDWTDESDADGLTDYYGQQVTVANEMFEAGECFVRMRPRRLSDGLVVPMQLQLLPSEMCPFEYNIGLGNGRRIECGVQFNAIGQREGYWFYRKHPGEFNFNYDDARDLLTFVPADQIIHLFKPIRAGQIRGVPHTLAGIITMALIDLYDDAELERKRTAALFAAFVTRNAGEDDAENPLGAPVSNVNAQTNQETVGLEPGATVDLLPGQDIKFSDPADVGGNYEAFQYRNLLRAAAGLGLPYSTMTGDLRQTSYGSQRAGMITFKRRITMMQNQVMIFQLCRPIAKAWLEAAVLSNSFKSFTPAEYAAEPRSYGQRIRWIPPRWDWIDPLKDVSAERQMVDAGFKARSTVIEEMGEDAHAVDEQIAADQARADELGIQFTQVATGIVVNPGGEDSVAAQNDSLTPGGGFPANNQPSDGPSRPKKKAAPAAKARKRTRYKWDK